ATLIRLRLPCAKNPIAEPSGDQNGNVASSVPGNTRGVNDRSGRTHSRDGPPPVVAVNASWRPSGDSVTVPKLASSGGRIEKRNSTSSRVTVLKYATPSAAVDASVAITKTAASDHASRS